MIRQKVIVSSIVAVGLAWTAAAVDCIWKGGEETSATRICGTMGPFRH